MKASRGVIDCSDACPRSSCEALVRIARICMPQGELKVTSISPPKKSIAFARGLRHTWTIEQHVVGRAARKPRACETTSAAKVASTSGTREPSEPRGAPAPPRAASPASGSSPLAPRRRRQGRPGDRSRPRHDRPSPRTHRGLSGSPSASECTQDRKETTHFHHSWRRVASTA